MTTTELINTITKLGVRKNNTIQVGNLIITKWGSDRYQIVTTESKYIGVAGIKWVEVKLRELGVI